jgi:hypothetical protein
MDEVAIAVSERHPPHDQKRGCDDHHHCQCSQHDQPTSTCARSLRTNGNTTGLAATTTDLSVSDTMDRLVARITEQRSSSCAGGNTLYDYTLAFEFVPDESLRLLSVVAALAEYLYYRVEEGGPLRALLWWT